MEFIENKDHEVVLDALRRFMDSDSVVLQALRVLIPLAAPGITHLELQNILNDTINLYYYKQY